MSAPDETGRQHETSRVLRHRSSRLGAHVKQVERDSVECSTVAEVEGRQKAVAEETETESNTGDAQRTTHTPAWVVVMVIGLVVLLLVALYLFFRVMFR